MMPIIKQRFAIWPTLVSMAAIPACGRGDRPAEPEAISSPSPSAPLSAPTSSQSVEASAAPTIREHVPPGAALKNPDCVACGEKKCWGPAKEKAKLCVDNRCAEWEHCVTTSGCINDKGDVRPCYCGETPFEECFGPDARPATGRCRRAAERLSGQTVPLQVGAAWFSWNEPLGIVNQELECMASECSAECFL
ncbi:MAG: hypothetical protein JW751_29425 [Polyangiaceae bacterium]|nr:hypothetical protein [Polyangiaceae bacterium]